MWVPLPASGALGWRAKLGVEIPLFSGETFAVEISLRNLSHCPWEGDQPFLCLHPSYQSRRGLFYKSLVIKTSLQLVFIRLFRLIAPYFSCNSSLVLGEGKCSTYLLCCHLGSPRFLLVLGQFRSLQFPCISYGL